MKVKKLNGAYPKFSNTCTRYQEEHCEAYLRFCMEKLTVYCVFCLKLLYPEEIQFHTYTGSTFESLFNEWGCETLRDVNDLRRVIVCDKHRLGESRKISYPGINVQRLANQLSYRERGCLSPIKIMTRITRGRAEGRQYCGHYQQSGTTWTEQNLELIQMLYGGLIGIPIDRDIMEPINVDRVRQLFRLLQQTNPHLTAYNEPAIQQEQHQAALRKIERLGQTEAGESQWTHSYVFLFADDPHLYDLD